MRKAISKKILIAWNVLGEESSSDAGGECQAISLLILLTDEETEWSLDGLWSILQITVHKWQELSVLNLYFYLELYNL